jgi:hypothetical protein
MHFHLLCNQCADSLLSRVEFRDDGRYEFHCKYGHEMIFILQQQKFEILFEIGVNAILDGYHREAISSFTASLERFYEFFIKVSFEHLGGLDSSFIGCWKNVSNYSERQLGGFIFLWGIIFGETPKLLGSDLVSSRNAVIHKGKIPSKDEAIIYGNSVLVLLRQYLSEIKTKLPQELVAKVTACNLGDARLDSDGEKIISCVSTHTLVSLAYTDRGLSIEEYLSTVSTRRQL